jgi:hypothetical protein
MKEEGKVVAHYGIHADEIGVMFLEQGRGSTNAVGLNKKSGLVVKLPSGKKHCNHMIPLSIPVPADQHWDAFAALLDDPLVRAMLPIPKADGGVYFVETQPNLDQVLVLLSKMSSPIHNIVVPAWMLTPQAIVTELQSTNVQPFVIVGVEPQHSQMLSQVAQAAPFLPRKVVFVGTSDVIVPPNVQRLKTKLASQAYQMADLMVLPWEALGAVVVRKFMRKEWSAKEPG